MSRFIISLIIIALIIATLLLNSLFINDVYKGLDKRISVMEARLPETDNIAANELLDYWQTKASLLSLSIKESEIFEFTLAIAKTKTCKGEEYISALATLRQLANELRKTESMEFFEIF